MAEYGIRPPGYRLPADTHLGSVRLQVGDLDRSVAYYERVLGFRVLGGTADAVSLGPQGEERALLHVHVRRGARPAPARGALGLYHFALLLPGRASLGRLLAHLGEIGVDAGAADHLVSEALYLTDPDGLGIEVYADRPRALWRVHGQQLHMTTEALDRRGLREAAGGDPWRGLPSGTVVGHIHLHVGDLDAAAEFYHAGLGFDKTVWEYPGALFMSAGGYHHHLGTNTWSRGGPAAADEARLLSWDVMVPRAEDAAAAAASLAARGFDVTERDTGWRSSDPWGTPLQIVVDHAARIDSGRHS